ncbi:MAG: alginate export family protein [Verrucomicrobia bacterium]|nr:alginate export family protein [Verrucomicrobiota bacterium]
MTIKRNQTSPLTCGSVLVLAITASVYAQEKPYILPGTGQPASPMPAAAAKPAAAAPKPAETGTFNSLFSTELPDAIGKSKLSINSRLRWEQADQDGLGAADLKESNALTLRTRFGLTSGSLYGFQGMLEGENVVSLIDSDNYNAAGSNGQPGRTVIADPETTELNQAWVSYASTNLNLSLKGGRQRIVLDNHRFIGDVGWRQNMQTFDAASMEVKPIKDLSVFYGYVWDVRRVFGDVTGLPAINRDFESDSHLMNVAYSGWKYGRFVGYTYLLDLENSAPASLGNSTATYGGYFAGTAPVGENLNLAYRAEFAWQTDYGKSPLAYDTGYWNVELGGTVKKFALGGGYELLGSDNNQGFRTPLATLHAFNGWADVFLNTPAAGLQDIYGFAQYTLPWQVPLRFVYHKFDAGSGSGDFGQEFDVQLSKKLGKNWTALAKYAFYDGKDAMLPSFASPLDVQKFWLQLEFNF